MNPTENQNNSSSVATNNLDGETLQALEPRCLQCNAPVPNAVCGRKIPCPFCGFPYPLGDCSDLAEN